VKSVARLQICATLFPFRFFLFPKFKPLIIFLLCDTLLSKESPNNKEEAVTIDISRPVTDYMPKARSTTASFWKSMLLLGVAISVAIIAGIIGLFILRAVSPTIPVYWALVIGIIAMVIVLNIIAKHFEWIMPWYYLLPAILFLLTFAFFPVILTVLLAFTDYAGARKGDLNISSETAITSLNGTQVTIADPKVFDCADLRNGCVGVRANLYASGTLQATVLTLEDTTLTLTEALPEGRKVNQVGIFSSLLGDLIQIPVVSNQGATLTLGRAMPADTLDLTQPVNVQLDRVPVQRLITAEDGANLTLNEALPEGLNFETMARYSDFGFLGLRNFREIFRGASRSLGPVFLWNVLFAVSTVILNTVVGVFLAVLLNNPNLRLRAMYRTLLIVSWALPTVITIQVWRGFLNQNFGAINRLLMLADITPTPINWLLGSEWAARAAVLLVNLWLGFPFMMTATLGALSAIPTDVYEAAKIDGATAWEAFWGVTAPLLRTALVPITLTGFAFNFNNFGLIFLLTDGGPPVDWGTATARGTDILVTWAYNSAFRTQGGLAYALGSAISLLIFAITVAVSLINFRVTGALKETSNT
jgi:arabinogalactan oligomer / maltooligosaccharide transport system permease protein